MGPLTRRETSGLPTLKTTESWSSRPHLQATSLHQSYWEKTTQTMTTGTTTMASQQIHPRTIRPEWPLTRRETSGLPTLKTTESWSSRPHLQATSLHQSYWEKTTQTMTTGTTTMASQQNQPCTSLPDRPTTRRETSGLPTLKPTESWSSRPHLQATSLHQSYWEKTTQTMTTGTTTMASQQIHP